ncbi:MAG: glutamine--fructose-6-phosphate transaminase (isomerizing) [Candidatus Omnitrophota bacterium]
MCGIVGYIGKRKALPILLEALERLEYRGYDSSGICLVNGEKIYIRKKPGKIKDLVRCLENDSELDSCIAGISHTRWATHGLPNEINAHPHFDCSSKIAVVHNGIIENYQELKTQLIKQGHKFRSQTDTEIIVHLIESNYKGDLLDAVRISLKKLRGSYAIGVISSYQPNRLIGARLGSPLVVGLGRDENFIASDMPAILKHTRRAIYLEDEQIVDLSDHNVTVYDLKKKIIKPKINLIKWSLDSAQKQGFDHFMLKEIFEQPQVLKRIFQAKIKDSKIHFEDFRLKQSQLRKIENIIIIACGTAYHAGFVGKYVIEELSRLPVDVSLSSEFRYSNPIIRPNTLVLAVSQSGETADTLAAVKEAKRKGAYILSICNVVGSSLTRVSDGIIYTHAGPEISVASTKAYIAQLAVFYLFGIYFAHLKRKISPQMLKSYIESLEKMPVILKAGLEKNGLIKKIAYKFSQFGSFLYLGRNINFPSALEGALKLKEISYIPAEGYAAGEMKHGPIALIDEYRAVICISPKSKVYEKMFSNIQEINARKGKIICIATKGDTQIKNYSDEVIYIQECEEMFSPLVVAPILQLLAYHIAVKRGCDVDQPRNLAKSVTVE